MQDQLSPDRACPPLPSAPRRWHLLAIAFAATLFVAYGSFVPLQFRELSWVQAVEQFRHIELLKWTGSQRADVIANILLYIPLGFFWLGVVDVDRRSRAAALLACPVLLMLLGGFSSIIEFGQQWSTRRTAAASDIQMNALGSGLGLLLWFLAGRALVQRVREITAAPGQPTATRRLLQLYALGFLLYSLQPLDVTFSAEEIRHKFYDEVVTTDGRRLHGRIVSQKGDLVQIEALADDGTRAVTARVDPVHGVQRRRVILRPFSHSYGGPAKFAWQVGSDLILFIPIGLWLRLGGRQPRSVIAATAASMVFAIGIEAAQLLVFSRYSDTTDIVTSTLGGIVGALLAGRLLRDSDASAEPRLSTGYRTAIGLALIALYFIPVALTCWTPLKLNESAGQFWPKLRGMIAVPFSHYYGTSEFRALSVLLRGLMLFAPIGALWCWAVGRRRGGVAGLLAMTFLLGLVIEVGKAFIEGRQPDVTDLGIYCCGSVAGWWIWSQLTWQRGTEHSHQTAYRAGEP